MDQEKLGEAIGAREETVKQLKKMLDSANRSLSKDWNSIQLDSVIKKFSEDWNNLSEKMAGHLKRIHDFTLMPFDPQQMEKAQTYASAYYNRLQALITEFERNLDEEHEVGLKLADFGHDVIIHISNIGYCNPALIILYGKLETGEDVHLIEHVNQLNIMLVSAKRLDPTEPKKQIGFES